ncbi:Vitamin B12 import ATP-binding protein BtuD [Candidatus Lokiarchaeum ossiferum]|uniref:Vitamin B12 import ATP-binding protein BtuD n=1 Tax=Candidatus Lokiarchaeum ossiferum TaxID=2951803 RepID=A0ABY6HMK2_9ARCH|nr:Vitamin B12 import ATP-binding protein BtuD [Candidatus Lokiarchaeum sp. B-35]
MQKQVETSRNLNHLEFKPTNDDFYEARQKKTYVWILKHLLYRNNKIFIFSWVILTIFSAIVYARVKVYLGEAIGSFTAGNTQDLIFYSVLILLLGIGSPLLDLLGNVLREILAQRMERDSRNELYLNLLGKSQSFHDEQRLGDIMARATNDVRQLNFLISPGISLIFESVINTIVPIVMVALIYSPRLAIIPSIYSVLFVVALKQYVNSLGPVVQAKQMEYGNLNAILNESLSGIEVIKGMAQEKRSIRLYQKQAKKYLEIGVKEGQIQARYFPLLMVAITITLSLVYAIILQQRGEMEVYEIIGYMGLILTLYFPTRISIWAFALVKRAIAGADRLLDTMNKSSEIVQMDNSIKKNISGDIEFKEVFFSYPRTENLVLKGVSFSAKAGETIAIVGTTGSGKTTCTKLISRLYDVPKGQILVDGIDIKDYELHSLRNQIAYIEQDIFLFSKSIFENIAFGRVTSKEEVIKAAKDAQAHEFILKLPKQYDTNVGERGVQLSGGERQRIAIARAFISDPKILVLDDSTSAIDSATEENIQRAISRILKGRTTLLITHRLSQIRWADKIIVFRLGKIVAQGSHEHLLKTSEEYRKIFLTRFDKTLEELLEENN